MAFVPSGSAIESTPRSVEPKRNFADGSRDHSLEYETQNHDSSLCQQRKPRRLKLELSTTLNLPTVRDTIVVST